MVLSVAHCRKQCRIDDTFEDALIEGYIAAAQREAALVSGRAVGQTVYRLALDQFPDDGEPILLPHPPIVSVTSLDYTDTNGSAASLDLSTDVQLDTWHEPGRIHPVASTWPDIDTDKINNVVITYTAGVDVGVDSELLQAIRLAVAGWYENREDVSESSLTTLPNGFDRLARLNAFRSSELVKFLSDH